MPSDIKTRDERRPFVLCADDFAMTEGVSRAILTLLERGRLSATCAMTNRPHWQALAGALRAHAGHADLGLHLNLTCAEPSGAMPTLAPTGVLPPLATLGRMAATSSAVRREIAAEIERQLDAYESAMGRAPDFIDGHQHVHVLPGVRHALLRALSGRYDANGPRPWLRNPSDKIGAIRRRGLFVTKALVLRALASGFGRDARRRGFTLNSSFAGFSDFRADRNYADAFRSYLLSPGTAHLVMCHPGHVDDELRLLDPVLAARENEFNFLMSAAFDVVLASAGMRLARFRELRGQ